jgi:hypothetical protein
VNLLKLELKRIERERRGVNGSSAGWKARGWGSRSGAAVLKEVSRVRDRGLNFEEELRLERENCDCKLFFFWVKIF